MTAGTGGARRGKCPRCRRPVLRQLVGRRAALDVMADDELLTADAAAARAGPNRLAWCARRSRAGIELRWLDDTGHAGCPNAHVLDHECAPALGQRQPAQPELF